MKNVAIVYHYFAHYRLPILEELSNSEVINYTFISGIDADTNIKLHNFSETSFLKWLPLKNIWLFKGKLLWQKGLIDFIRYKDFDSVIFLGNPYHLSTWFAVLLCRFKGIKVFYWMHGFYKNQFSWFDYIKVFVFYKMANGFLLYGNRSAEILKNLGVKDSKDIYVIYNSLDYGKSLKLRKNYLIKDILDMRRSTFGAEDIPIICFIGRVNSIKKIHLLIEAQKILKEKFKTIFFNLIIIGEGEELNTIKSLSISYGLENNCMFTGALYDENAIASFLSFSDLCVVPGEVGLTSIHSLSYGTPVISHDDFNVQMPEAESIIDGVTGLLFEQNNLEDLVIKIENWLTLYPIKTQDVVSRCYSVIDSYYNPVYQKNTIESAILNN